MLSSRILALISGHEEMDFVSNARHKEFLFAVSERLMAELLFYRFGATKTQPAVHLIFIEWETGNFKNEGRQQRYDELLPKNRNF